MSKLITFRRSLRLLIFLLIAAAIYATPWGLYWLGLHGVDGKPSIPATLITAEQQFNIWNKAGCEGEPEMVALDPVSYIVSAGTQDTPSSTTQFAWRVASAYNRTHKLHEGGTWWQLSGAAMTIWLTRNWSVQQLLSKVAEIEAGKKP